MDAAAVANPPKEGTTKVLKRVTTALCAVAAGAIVFAGASGTAAASSALVVDDDDAQCENAEFTSIQAAVAAASPGGVIMVCAFRASAFWLEHADRNAEHLRHREVISREQPAPSRVERLDRAAPRS